MPACLAQRCSAQSIRCRSSADSFFSWSAGWSAGLAANLVPPPKARSGFCSSQRRRAVLGVRAGEPAAGEAPKRSAGTRGPLAGVHRAAPAGGGCGVPSGRCAAVLAGAGRCCRAAAALRVRCWNMLPRGGRPASSAGAAGLTGVGMRELLCARRDIGSALAVGTAGRSAGFGAGGGGRSAGLAAGTGGRSEGLAADGAGLATREVAGACGPRAAAAAAEMEPAEVVGRMLGLLVLLAMAAAAGRAAGAAAVAGRTGCLAMLAVALLLKKLLEVVGGRRREARARGGAGSRLLAGFAAAGCAFGSEGAAVGGRAAIREPAVFMTGLACGAGEAAGITWYGLRRAAAAAGTNTGSA